MIGNRLTLLIGLAAVLTVGCDDQPVTGGAPAPGSQSAAAGGWNDTDWDPIECLALPDTRAEVAQTPRERPDLELLALRLSSGIVAQTSHYERLVVDLAAIAVLEHNAPTSYHAAHDGRQLLISAAPQTLTEMAEGSYDAWNCLNSHYEVEFFENAGHHGVLRLKGTYELQRLAQLYARLPGVGAAEPDALIGDASTLYVTRMGDEWHYVAEHASGDCPAGCIDRVLHYFISEPGGAVRYMDRWTVIPGQQGPSWVDAHWREAETRVGPPPPLGMADPNDPFADFDRERSRAEAQALLGLPEAELTQGANLRVVRRGDEQLPVTMDLRPGRLNVELDADDSGVYRVTRVVVEVPEGTLVVE